MITVTLNDSLVISDHIIGCDAIPVMTERNKDYIPLISEFSFYVSKTYTGSVAAGQSVKAFLNNVIFFQGEIAESKYDYQERAYYVIARSSYYKLQERKITYYNLHNDFATGTTYQYTPSDNFGLPNVQVLWAITKMMHSAGFTNFKIPSNVTDRIIKTIIFGGVSYNMTIDDLKMDENMLYAINQSSAINTTGILADYQKIQQQISYWDFISEFCSHFALQLWMPATGSIWLIPVNDPDIITDDDIVYFKEVKSILGAEGGYVHNLAFNPDRAKYNNANEDPLTDHSVVVGEGAQSINAYTNWVYMFRKPNFPIGDVLNTYPDYCYESTLFLQNKIKAEINDFTETEIQTDLVNDLTAIHCRINPETSMSEIIWAE